MKRPVLPLVLQKNKEPLKSWEGISTPSELAAYLATVFSVDPNQLLQFEEIVFQEIEPVGEEAKKLWIKTDLPVGLGLPSGEGYNMIYQYPPNVAMLWLKGEEKLPDYLRKLTSDQLTDYGLTDPSDKKVFWIVLDV